MSAHDPLFWLVIITAIIAISFIVIAGAMIAIATFVNRAVNLVNRLEDKLLPLMARVAALCVQGQPTAVYGVHISDQLNVMSGYLSKATMHISELAAIIS